MRILITSFGPFNNFKVNPSNLAMKLLREKMTDFEAQHDLYWRELGVSYDEVHLFEKEFSGIQLDLVLHLGVATNDSLMRLEIQAKNQRQGKDVNGLDPTTDSIIENQSDIKTGINIQVLENICSKQPSIVRISNDAGAYLCNYIYYLSLSSNLADRNALFIHIADTQNNSNAVSLEDQVLVILDLVNDIISSTGTSKK
jgi:pyroglutamyl-peptidase